MIEVIKHLIDTSITGSQEISHGGYIYTVFGGGNSTIDGEYFILNRVVNKELITFETIAPGFGGFIDRSKFDHSNGGLNQNNIDLINENPLNKKILSDEENKVFNKKMADLVEQLKKDLDDD